MTHYDDTELAAMLDAVMADEGLEGSGMDVLNGVMGGKDAVLAAGPLGALNAPGAMDFMMTCMNIEIPPQMAFEAVMAAQMLIGSTQVRELHRNRVEPLFDGNHTRTVANTMIYATAMIRAQADHPRPEMRKTPEEACLVFAAVGFLMAAQAEAEPAGD